VRTAVLSVLGLILLGGGFTSSTGGGHDLGVLYENPYWLAKIWSYGGPSG